MEKPMNLEEVLQALYDSEINVAISWLWDGGIDIGLVMVRNRLSAGGGWIRTSGTRLQTGDGCGLAPCGAFTCGIRKTRKKRAEPPHPAR
jgi:hypothetical protein